MWLSKLAVNVGELQLRRTLAASRGFLAAGSTAFLFHIGIKQGRHEKTSHFVILNVNMKLMKCIALHIITKFTIPDIYVVQC